MDDEAKLGSFEDLLPSPAETVNRDFLVQLVERLQLLHQLVQSVVSRVTVNDICTEALAAAVKLCGAERAFLLTANAQGELSALAGFPASVSLKRGEWRISSTITEKVLQENRALLTNDAHEDFALAKSIDSHHIRSAICVPLKAKEKTIGVLYADTSDAAGVFDTWDLRFLHALGQCVQWTLHNTEASKVSLERNEELWRRKQEELLESHEIVGRSQSLLAVFERLRMLAAKQLPLLILGESGTGKELFAQAAHRLSPRSRKPFVAVNIAALNKEVMESELFGHVKGAFTNAYRDRKGRFELADGGTLFLDEVAEIPLPIQAMLLRVLETGQVERVGDDQGPIALNVRLVCATNVDLEQAAHNGTFRPDLYYRLAGAKIELPPLRNRIDDLEELVPYLLTKIKSNKSLDARAYAKLRSYRWPGNVRQLLRVLEEVDAVCHTSIVTDTDLPAYIGPEPIAQDCPTTEQNFPPLKAMIGHVEQIHMRLALAQAGGNSDRAIELLGIGREQFFRKKKLYGLS